MSPAPQHWRSLKEQAKNGPPEDFAVILGLCLSDLAAGRATIEECLQRHPAQADQLAELLRLAEQERAMPPPGQTAIATPSPDQGTPAILPADQGITAVLPPDQGSIAALSDSPPDALAGGPID